MTRGQPEQSISVVAGSRTGKFTGLDGRMIITIDTGQHSYRFDYALPEAQQ
ncbi:MAG TPA: DUF3224 domain-containing protein [Paraburkholderia sp.]|jgi:hypothetical protein